MLCHLAAVKVSLHSSIVQIIFSFWSFEIMEYLLRLYFPFGPSRSWNTFWEFGHDYTFRLIIKMIKIDEFQYFSIKPYVVSGDSNTHPQHNWAASWENQQSAYAKTKTQISFAVTAKLISAFVFAIWIVQYLYFLNTKFQSLAFCSSCTAWFVSDLVKIHAAAHIISWRTDGN